MTLTMAWVCKYCGKPEKLPGEGKCPNQKCSPIPYYVRMVRPRLQRIRTWVPKSFNQKRIPALAARLHFNEGSWPDVDKILNEPWPFGHFTGIWNV